MQIRQAEPRADAAACAEIYAPFVRDTVISFETEPPDEVEMRGRIERISTRYPWLVAEHDEAVVGFAYASAHRERAAYRWAADVAVYVDPGQHRRGAGRALYETLLADLSAQGFRIACAGIALPNDASIGLHEAVGFKLVGIYRRIGWKLGAWHDVAWYQAALGDGDLAPPEPGPPARRD